MIDKDSEIRLDELSRRIAANPSDEDAFIERGRLHWALGHRGAAINDYLTARNLNPEGRAAQLLRATYDILDFYNKDLYNP